MTLIPRSSRSLIALAAFAVSLAALPLAADPIPVTYQFTGTCTDCTGIGTGMLTLLNYTPGNILTPDTFVSFTYSSNLLSFSILSSSELTVLMGSLPGGMPGVSFVKIQDMSGDVISTDAGGAYWCAGNLCGQDNGTTYTWSAADVSGAPEPTTLVLMGTALLGLGIFRRRSTHV